MSNQRQYEKVSGGSNNVRWEPHKSTSPVYTDANPAVLEGYYLKAVPRHSPENGDFMVHEVQAVNTDGSLGEMHDVSLGVGLDNTLRNIPLGTFVCIQFKGKKASKTPGRKFNDTDVFQDKNAIPYNELTGTYVAPASATAHEQKAVNTGTKNPVAAAVNNPFPNDDFDEVPF